jgi:hypothetical protein
MATEKSTGDNNGWLLIVVALVAIGGVYYFFFRPHPPNAEELVGAWTCADQPWVIEFSKGDAVLMQTLGAVRSGSYRVETDGTLKVDMNDGKGFKAKAEIKGEELTLTDADGTKTSFKRVTPALTPPPGPGPGPPPNTSPPPPTTDPDLDRAYQEALKARDTKWAVCTGPTGTSYLFTKVVAPKANTFTPVLGAPPEGTAMGFYQFSTPIVWEHETVRLTTADQQNGLRKRYRIHWFTPSYRSWDGQGLKKWSEWQTGRLGEKDKVNFLNSTVTLMADGQWKVEEAYNLGTTNPALLTKPVCNEIPG